MYNISKQKPYLFIFVVLRDVFQCSVLTSFWRVRHAWLKNLIKRCMETELRVQISKWLGQTVYDICRGQATVGLFEVLMEDFVDGSSFMDYFKATWYPRIRWLKFLFFSIAIKIV